MAEKCCPARSRKNWFRPFRISIAPAGKKCRDGSQCPSLDVANVLQTAHLSLGIVLVEIFLSMRSIDVNLEFHVQLECN